MFFNNIKRILFNFCRDIKNLKSSH